MTLDAHEEVVRLAERRVRRLAERRQAIEAEQRTADDDLKAAIAGRTAWIENNPDPQIMMF